MSNRLDIFLHIPKTGGITLYQILEHNYPPQSMWKVYPDSWDDLRGQVQALSPQRRAGLRLLTGHIPYGVHTLFERPARYFTILREPVERTLSYYYYVRSHPDNPQYNQVRAMSLEEYVTSGLLLDNGQVRWLAGLQADTPFGGVTMEHLETATANLRTCLVGIMARYDESLLLFRYHLGWRWLFYCKRNVNKQRPPLTQIDPQTRKTIASIHALDEALYLEACQLFAQQVERIGLTTLQYQTKFFRSINRLYTLASRMRHTVHTS
ncbi:MAG: hypothetical protein D6755_09305 [Anaerolineae bacterium]|nr:MAG: hypothetical protein D6755_09305 [Anaerolineae bacterium]